MKKYYVGLLVMMILALCFGGYTVSQGSSAKKDKNTISKLDTISTALSDYTDNTGTIPANLDEVGVKDVPSTITYDKISDSEYKVCVTFYQASNGFDAGWTGLFGGLAGAGSQSPQSTSPSSYLDTYTLDYSHKKGQNCQTVKPYTYNLDNGSQQNNSIQF